jgi:AsmA protein
MKKLLIGIAGLVLLLVAVIAAAPFVLPALIPVETYKQQIAEGARQATGRELTIKGDFKLSVLPRLELAADEVAFANAPGAREPQMLTLKQLLVRLQVLPLLFGEVKVDRFVLVEPVIHLEVDKKGKANWQFEGSGAGAAGQAEAQTAGETAQGAPAAGAEMLQELSLGEVRLERGRLSYSDLRSGQSEQLEDVNLELFLPDFASPFGAEGSLIWRGERLALELEGDSLRSLLDGAATRLALGLKSNPVSLYYKGQATLAPALDVGGEVDLDVPSIRALAAWTGNPLEDGGRGLGPLKIKGNVAVTEGVYAFTGAEIALDNMFAIGDLTADTRSAKPYLKGGLDLDQLDLNTYLPPPAAEKGEASGEAAGEGPPPGWSDEPLDLAALHAVNADFDLSVGAIKVQDIKIGRSALSISLKDGLLVSDLTELALYGGTGRGRIQIDARKKVPAVEKSLTLTGVEAEPLLVDAAGLEKLQGTGNIEIAVKAQGRSQREMVEALSGQGAVKFTDGAIKGLNLAAMARNPGDALMRGATGDDQKTDFAELTGSFRIKKGRLRNKDLLMLSPLLRVTGEGKADIPARSLDYRIKPKLVGSLEGQGGASDVTGIAVPILIEGPWHDLSYRPDTGAIVEEVAKDPGKAAEDAKQTLKKLKKSGGDGKVDPKKALENLLGN